MALSEIEKLERRYAENPQGLTFAPLAEVHRKNGEVQRALDLLGPGLQIHPDYIPASIVLGRCHMDMGDVQAAETAFLHVLDLDGENVIALKALADISERLLKFDDAERWLHTLLTVDRSNDDAREQLQRVEIARRQAGVASSAEPSTILETEAPVETAAEPVAAPIVDIVSPPPAFEPPPPPPLPAMGFEDLEPSALRSDFLDEPAAPPPDEPARVEQPIEPLDGLVGREVDTPDEVTPEVREPGYGGFGDDFSVETAEEIVLESAGGSEFQMPDASQELSAFGAAGERGPFEEDAPAPSAERKAEPERPEFREPVRELHDLTPDPPEPNLDEPEAWAPEPMAPDPPAPPAPEPLPPEPFVYEPPKAEPVLAALEAVAVPAPAAPAPPALPKRPYGAGVTGGRSTSQLFKGILAARPPVQAAPAQVRQPPPAGTSGAPTRPAADSLSLSSVFGEEGSDTPPAVSAANAGAGSVSFDDFFGSPSASPAARTPRAPDPKNDDLDQFHAWLQNLKR